MYMYIIVSEYKYMYVDIYAWITLIFLYCSAQCHVDEHVCVLAV